MFEMLPYCQKRRSTPVAQLAGTRAKQDFWSI